MADDAILAQRAQIERQIAGRTVCDLLQDNADRYGEAPAASWRDGGTWHTLGWREYHQRVVEVAAGLASLGADHGDFVALMMSNRPEHVIADQGAVHAGAVPTTLYATLAPEQIRYCAAHCAAKVAILEHRDLAKRWQELREGLPALQHVVVLEGAGDLTGWEGVLGWDELLARGRDALAADPDLAGRLRGRVRPEDPVTLVYTSGTIGPPKGVILSHRNVLYECAAVDRLLRLPDGIAGVSYLPLAHIAERALTIYSPLWKHNQVYFCPELTEVISYVQHARPLALFGVPRVWEKVWAGLVARLDAEPPPARPGGAAGAACPPRPTGPAGARQDPRGPGNGPLPLRGQRRGATRGRPGRVAGRARPAGRGGVGSDRDHGGRHGQSA